MTGSFDSTTAPDNPIPLSETLSDRCIVCDSPCLPGAVLCDECDHDERPDLERIVAEMAARFPVGELAQRAREIAIQASLSTTDATGLWMEAQREVGRQFEAFCGRVGRPRTERREEL